MTTLDATYRGVFLDTGSNESTVIVRGNEFTRLMYFMKRKWLIVFIACLMVCAGSGPLIVGLHMANMMSDLVETHQYIASVKEGIIRICPTIVMFLTFLFGSHHMVDIITARCISETRDMMFHNIVEQDITYFDHMSTGVLISRLAEDTTFTFDTYIEKLMTIILYVSQILSGIVIAFITCWRVTLATVGVIPIVVILYYVADYIVTRYSKQFRDTSSLSAEKAEEVMTSFRTVKSSGCELYEAAEYTKNIESIHQVVTSVSHIHAGKNALLTILSWGVIAPIIYYSSWLLTYRPYIEMNVGDLALLVNCFSNTCVSVAMIITSIDDFMAASVSAAKLLSVLEAIPKRNCSDGVELNESHGKIEFRDVCFKYPNSDIYAINHLSFTVNPGETIALVGESGCGKSTTLALLQQFYEIESGMILIDDIDTSTLTSASVRAAMSIVPQIPVLFSMSILDNIRYARPEATQEEVVQAAQRGNAHDFIMEIPENYDAFIEQASLSGGQKQRICISRAILADTPILLLDEATAALDTENEQLVQQSLETCRTGKTTIIVAHRLSTIRNADRILVFQNGAVIETGTHDELLVRDAVYANLIKSQLHYILSKTLKRKPIYKWKGGGMCVQGQGRNICEK
jgi:ABC-type multidrug transport system fused ATPase/permease subunit